MTSWFKILIAAALASTAFAASRNIPLDTAQFSTQASAPSSPTSGTVFSYFLNSDGLPYWKTSAGSVLGYLYSAANLTNHGVLVGAGTRQPGALTVASDNTVMVGNTGADPSFRQIMNGDVSSSAAIDPSKFATQSQATLLGRNAGAGTGVPSALTATQVTALLNAMVGDSGSGGTQGMVPAPGAGDYAALKYLDAGGNWSVPGGGGSTAFDKEDIYLSGGAGHGSTNTKVRTYTNVRVNRGTKMTLTQSSINGDKIVVNSAGSYMFCAGDSNSGAAPSLAIVVNGSAGTTSASTPLTYAQGKRDLNLASSSTDNKQVCWWGILATNDYVWVQDDGGNNLTTDFAFFFGTYLGTGTSSAYLENGSGYGSTNTKIRKYTNSRGTTGSNITVTQSSTNGDSFTVNADGLYAGCAADGSDPIGITVNDSAMTTNVFSLTYANGLRSYAESAGNSTTYHTCFLGFLSSGDILRAHSSGGSTTTTSASYFYLTEIASGSTFSRIFLTTPSGHGSTATKIRTFSALKQFSGQDLQYVSSSVYGDSIKIRVEGEYAVCWSDAKSASLAHVALTVNGESVATNASSPIDYSSNGLRAGGNGGGNYNMPLACFGGYLGPGDVLRAQDDGSNDYASDQIVWTIVKTR